MFNIIILGIASMLTYVSKEIVYPILPLYLTSVLGITPASVGLIEGITKSLTSIVKFYSGYFSDKKKRRKKYVIIGYFCAFLHKILLILSTSWLWIISAKTVERLGKSIRLAPKDAIIAESCRKDERGVAFGILRTFDKLGAVIGIIIVYILMTKFTIHDYRHIFFVSSIPVFIAVILLLFIKQEKDRFNIVIDFKRLSKNVQLFFIVVFLSSLGNSTKSFLILKASTSGFYSTSVILLYLMANLTTCLLAYPVGKLCDRVSKKKIIIFAYLVFAITYFGFGLTDNKIMITLLFSFYGLFIALISIGAKTFIIENTPEVMKATALGINECLIGLSSLPAAIIAGILWNINPSYPFYFSFVVGMISVILMTLKVKNYS